MKKIYFCILMLVLFVCGNVCVYAGTADCMIQNVSGDVACQNNIIDVMENNYARYKLSDAAFSGDTAYCSVTAMQPKQDARLIVCLYEDNRFLRIVSYNLSDMVTGGQIRIACINIPENVSDVNFIVTGKNIIEPLASSVKVHKQTPADLVKAKIAAIGEVTLASGEAIANAEAAYDALTEEQKALVDNYDVLKAARETFNKKVSDRKAADEVIAKIATIGEVTLASGEAIANAEAAYDALTEEQKALVNNYDVLKTARKLYNELTAKPKLLLLSVTSDKSTVSVGETVTFTVSADNAKDMEKLQFAFDFDNNALKYTGFKRLAGKGIMYPSDRGAKIGVAYIPDSPLSGSFDVVNLQFEVISVPADGKINYGISNIKYGIGEDSIGQFNESTKPEIKIIGKALPQAIILEADKTVAEKDEIINVNFKSSENKLRGFQFDIDYPQDILSIENYEFSDEFDNAMISPTLNENNGRAVFASNSDVDITKDILTVSFKVKDVSVSSDINIIAKNIKLQCGDKRLESADATTETIKINSSASNLSR